VSILKIIYIHVFNGFQMHLTPLYFSPNHLALVRVGEEKEGRGNREKREKREKREDGRWKREEGRGHR
jgi:hypothetical protein